MEFTAEPSGAINDSDVSSIYSFESSSSNDSHSFYYYFPPRLRQLSTSSQTSYSSYPNTDIDDESVYSADSESDNNSGEESSDSLAVTEQASFKYIFLATLQRYASYAWHTLIFNLWMNFFILSSGYLLSRFLYDGTFFALATVLVVIQFFVLDPGKFTATQFHCVVWTGFVVSVITFYYTWNWMNNRLQGIVMSYLLENENL